MEKVEFTEEDLRALHCERFHHPHPRVMLKMEVVYLKCKGYGNAEISDITGVCGNTLRKYVKQFSECGIAGLKEVNFNRPNSDLKDYSGTIEAYFTENPPRSIREAAAKIREVTGIARGETQVRKFLKSMKFRFIKTCSVPAKALTEGKKRAKRIFGQRTQTSISTRKRKEKKRKESFCLPMQHILYADHLWDICGVLSGCLFQPCRADSDTVYRGQ